MMIQDPEYPQTEEIAPLPEEYPASMEFGETKKRTANGMDEAESRKASHKKKMHMAFIVAAILYSPLVTPDWKTSASPKEVFDIVQPESILEASSLIELGGDPSEDNTEVPSTIDETSSDNNISTSAKTQDAPVTGTQTTPVSETPQQVVPETVASSGVQTDTVEPTRNTSPTSTSEEPANEESTSQLPVNDCGVCGGTGKCDECKGDGYLGPGHQVSCPRCHGSGVETCAYCDGAGNSLKHEGTCDFAPCMGSHTYACTICAGGTSSVTCASCGGTGKCQACSQ